MSVNPFYELYLADSMSATEFVTLFSPALIPHVQPLFLPGNVVVVGMQGSGKSMLLTLLRAETRLKYEQVAHEFPVPKERRRFISCAVNLAHSNSTDFGYRDWLDDDPREVEMLFGDFVNSLLVSDLLQSLRSYITRGSEELRGEIGVLKGVSALDEVAASVAERGIWNGWLNGVRDWGSLQLSLMQRIVEYRGYLHRRKKSISAHVRETKTSIGEPIGEIADLLRTTGIIAKDTNVFVDIDQYEELGNIRTAPRNQIGVDYRGVINRAISRRDPRVSYRIGSRRHSWRSHSMIMGSEGKLEEERDYKFVDLDLLLKRGENRSTYIFPDFAEDVFQRRMNVAGLARPGQKVKVAGVYGKPETPAQKANFYKSDRPEAKTKFPAEWRESTKNRLERLSVNDPLSAKLGEAWIRQKGDIDDFDVRDGLLPWERKAYWKKERIEIALLQLASANQQRPIYSGDDEIFDLSNGNVLVFISINQHIWDQYFRYATRNPDSTSTIPFIGRDLQSAGIFKASEHWYTKIAEETGRSAERLRLIAEISRFLRDKIMGDRKMSNPGATGFSVRESELDAFPRIASFLEELSDYGNLTMLGHTTRDKDRAARIKWYLSPILCPFIRLPYKRIKEPYYASIKEVAAWFVKASVSGVEATSPSAPAQQSLF
jgi:hypothetical protein